MKKILMLAIGTPSFSPIFAQTPKALSSKKVWIFFILCYAYFTNIVSNLFNIKINNYKICLILHHN